MTLLLIIPKNLVISLPISLMCWSGAVEFHEFWLSMSQHFSNPGPISEIIRYLFQLKICIVLKMRENVSKFVGDSHTNPVLLAGLNFPRFQLFNVKRVGEIKIGLSYNIRWQIKTSALYLFAGNNSHL